MTIATVSARGSVVIPKEMRERYNFRKGDKLHFIDYGGVISIVPASRAPLKDAASMLNGGTCLTQALLRSRKLEAG